MSNIFNLAYLRIGRNRKSSLLFFLVLLLSFSAAIVSVSTVGSIDYTNAEYRLNTYGEWYFAIPCGNEGDGKWLSEKSWVDSLGTAQSVGTVSSSEKTIGFGTIDEVFIEMGHIRLDQGVFPSSDSEIAMEADSLSALDRDYTLGQQITLTVMLPVNGEKHAEDSESSVDVIPVEKTYTLCGVIHEYTDLWYLQNNKNNVMLNSAIITREAAESLLSEAGGMLEGTSVKQPVFEYFMTVSEENRETAKEELDARFESKRLSGSGDLAACVNTAAYVGRNNIDYDAFYMYIIAILTFISILCIEIIRLPSDTHSFSVLRSVGMSKGQLALMQMFETLLLGLSAMLSGIPLGAGLTWIVLRLMLYSGSVPIQVYIPYDTLVFILGLWLAAILISRIIMFIFTLRVPLIGRFQLSRARSRGTRLIRSGFIVLLLFVFSAGTIYTAMESLRPEYLRQYYSSVPSYIVGKWDDKALYESDISLFEEIPGISEAYGLTELYIGLSFDGLSEEDVYSAASQSFEYDGELPLNMVYLLAIDENDWDGVFTFGSGNDRTAFHNGEFVYVCDFDDGNEYPMPEKEAKLHIYGYKENEGLRFGETDNVRTFIESRRVNTKIMPASSNLMNRGVSSVWTPYTVICSERFLQNLLETLPEGNRWWIFTTGGEFGYERAFVTADLNSDDLSTDTVIAEMCKNRELSLSNSRQVNLAVVQENVQSLIMLYFSGGCICLIALMILWSNVSLEAKNEKRSFLIKRCIGMSKRQVYFKVFAKSLLRCLIAYLISWTAYILYAVLTKLAQYESLGESIDFSAALEYVTDSFKYNGADFITIAVITLIGLGLPLVMILFAKKELGKDGDAK